METITEIEKTWMQKEADELKANQPNFDGEKKPALKFEENKTTEMVIDFSKPFDEWTDPDSKAVKKIIPAKVGAVDFVWWLNVKNPIYQQIIEASSKGKTDFKVLQTGTNKATKYSLVD